VVFALLRREPVVTIILRPFTAIRVPLENRAEEDKGKKNNRLYIKDVFEKSSIAKKTAYTTNPENVQSLCLVNVVWSDNLQEAEEESDEFCKLRSDCAVPCWGAPFWAVAQSAAQYPRLQNWMCTWIK
jgi:hypothetical protein